LETVRGAYARGLRFFDTAPLYGHGLSEQRTGRVLSGLPRDEFVLATKVGRLLRADAPPDDSQLSGGLDRWPAVPPLHPVFAARAADFDCFLVAGRYTLLDQTALRELFPLCLERGIAVVLGGVYNSGILADPRPGAMFDYSPAPPKLVERAQRIDAVCRRHDVP